MRHLIIAIFIVVFAFNSFGQKTDTVLIQKQNLDFRYLQTGNSSYIIYFKKTETSTPERMMLVKMNVEPTVVNGKKAFAIKQEWDSGDEVVHTSYTLHDADDFSTLRQEAWWKQWGYTAKFDFITKQVTFDGPVTDATRSRVVDAFNESFASYNLCWHSDLTIFPMFPYKDGRVIKVNFYDPGGSLKSQIAEYTISGSESLTGSNGQKIDCWIMDFSYKAPTGDSGTQRFWISKQTREVLKEEDRFNGGFRYKMKIGISGER